MTKRFRAARGRTVPGSKSLKIGVVLSEGNYVAAEWTSHRKVVDAPDYENVFFGLFESEDGKIKLLREYLDTLAVQESRWGHARQDNATAARLRAGGANRRFSPRLAGSAPAA